MQDITTVKDDTVTQDDLSPGRKLQIMAGTLRDISLGLSGYRDDDFEGSIANAESLLLQIDMIRESLDAALQPAKKKHILLFAQQMVVGWPGSSKDRTTEKLLVKSRADMVVDALPSSGALYMSFVHLMRNSAFMPSVKEILDTLHEMEQTLKTARYHARNLPGKIIQVTELRKSYLAERESWIADQDEI
jgi:hypothetical protein